MAEGFNNSTYSFDRQNSRNNDQEQNTNRPQKKNYNKNFRGKKNEYRNQNYGRNKSQPRPRRNNKDSRDRSESPLRNRESLKEIGRSHLVDLESKDAENIILFFSTNSFAFGELLSEKFDFNKVVLFLRVISKLCTSSFVEYKSKIIMQIMNKDFLQKLQIHIYNLAVQDEREKRDSLFFWADQNRFWNDILILYNTILEVTPKHVNAKLSKSVQANVIALKNTMNDNSTNLEDILQEFELLKQKIETEKQKKNSFRGVSIFPSVKEITSSKQPPLDHLKKEGGYLSVEQYLDRHFRLLREDYFRSLRTGICTYLENQKSGEKTKHTEIRIYENVKFIRPHITKDRVGILIDLSSKFVKEQSAELKLFKYGSLVCFTKDNFQSIVYGTVVDNELAKQANIVVDVYDTILYGQKYTMVESTEYFEPYHQVLKALQNIKDDNFPMKKYLINTNTRPEPPKFLNSNSKIFLSQPIAGKKFFKILSTESWPPKEYFKLNSSQYSAFKTALTREFCVIQGPPGTGKTYTGYKIVEFLLKNKHNLQFSGPILVLCYTNHALDQFLEGIMPFCNNIVRVGSQSKNPKMDDLNLRCHRRRMENEKDSICKGMFEAEKLLYEQSLQKLQCLQNLLEDITSKTGILDFKLFKTIDDQLENSWFDISDPETIIRWLTTDMDLQLPTLYFTTSVEVSQKPYSKSEPQETKILNQNKNYNSEKDFVKNCIITISEIETKIKDLSYFADDLRYKQNASHDVINNCQRDLKQLQKKLEYLQFRLRETNMNATNLYSKQRGKINYNSPFHLNPNERWELYRHWVHLLHLQTYQDISILDEEYRTAKRRYQEIQHIVDAYIMQEKSVIGMTTSNAARLQPVLQTLKSEIVIVEEAAEVLESHIVASITNHCQQLILIGDHLQLKPNTSNYKIGKTYNLEISLFERMINNGIHYQQLEVQHRMRPEFVKLITPTIYSNLKNDDTVLHYPSVKGLAKNLFFITHNEYEQRMRETTSHKNVFEAKYLAKFANYLVKQGYTTEEITILTTYAGQQNLLTKECNNFEELKNIRITNVDNFQGEENKIILLSLVRSNEKDNIGFVKIENRVCVALSRAKEGFYMIGNMDNLEKSSAIWPKIVESLTQQESIGTMLPLKCQIHRKETKIAHHNDFDQLPNGGCYNICGSWLKCGHTCKLQCHLTDRQHKKDDYNCQEPCRKTICQLNHLCPKRCSEPCAEKCLIIVNKTLICGHSNIMSCSLNTSDYKCISLKLVKLPCGHPQKIRCSDSLAQIKCSSKCESTLICGHKCRRTCHINNDPNHMSTLLNVCKEPCMKIKTGCSTLTHKCRRSCSEACEPCRDIVVKMRAQCNHSSRVACNQNVNDVRCTGECEKQLKCGHKCKRVCHVNNDPDHMSRTENFCQEPCGKIKTGCSTLTHKCTRFCSDACEPCREIVVKMRAQCNHALRVACNQNTNDIKCTAECRRMMGCGHRCTNQCGSPCGQCQAIVDKIVPTCGHAVSIQCGLLPQRYMCRNKCPLILKCGHKCRKNCNEECYCSKCNSNCNIQ